MMYTLSICGLSKEYQNGIQEFIDLSMRHSEDKKTTIFPCKKCCNVAVLTLEEVQDHLVIHAIMISRETCFFPWRTSFETILYISQGKEMSHN